MLALAPRAPGLVYVAGEAERVPIAAGAVGPVTKALAFRWLDRDRFLAEARRVLTPGDWLAIYHNPSAGTMREEPSLAAWVRTVYLRRYPSPPAQPASPHRGERRGPRLPPGQEEDVRR